MPSMVKAAEVVLYKLECVLVPVALRKENTFSAIHTSNRFPRLFWAPRETERCSSPKCVEVFYGWSRAKPPFNP